MPRLLLAHPFTEAELLPVSPLVVAALVVSAIVLTASFGPPPRRTDAGPLWRTRAGPLTTPEVAGRLLAVSVLVGAVVAGRVGATSHVSNLASVLLLGVGWPLVAAASVLGAWRIIDPFDGLARVLQAPDGDDVQSAPPVWAAVGPAGLLVWYLGVYTPAGLAPRTLSLVVALYTLVTAAGCLALGRRWWLERVEAVGLLLFWGGGVRGTRLASWRPPPGAGAVLGVACGGLLFGLLRRTTAWSPVVFWLGPETADAVGLAAGMLLCAALVMGADRLARPAGRGSACAAVVPITLALAVALSLAGGRLLVAAQLVPGVLVDPLGRGWTVAGIGQRPPNTLPFGMTGIVLIQTLVLAGGGLLAARVLRARRAPWTAITLLAVLVLAGVLLVVTR